MFSSFQSQRKLFSMNTGPKPIHCVVGNSNGLLGSSEGHGHQDWAKYLLHDDPAGCVDSSYQGWRIETSWRTVSLEHVRTFITSLLNKLLDRFTLGLIHNSSHVDGLVQTVANTKVTEPGLEFVDELVKHC